MISKRSQEMLNQQIGLELTASQQYVGMAAYRGGLNLLGWQAFAHAAGYASLLEANQTALAYEQKVARDFQAQWYVQEQIEEESQFGRWVSLLESGLNPFLAKRLLPKGEKE